MPSGRVDLTATGGDLSLATGGSIDVAGVVQQYDGVSVASPGGSVSLTSAGNITLAGGSSIDVSAGSGGQARIARAVRAGHGRHRRNRASWQAPSRARARPARAAPSASTLRHSISASINTLLNAGGFAGGRSVRLRGPGDLEVAAAGKQRRQRGHGHRR